MEPCVFNSTFVVFLFSEGALIKVGYHAMQGSDACSSRGRLIDNFASRFGLVATGSNSDRRVVYQGETIGISAKTTFNSVSLEFIRR